MSTQGKRGFTLIELLVVIAIIGMLAAVILASLGTARAKARDARRVSDISQIQTALELYFDKAQSYASNTTFTTDVTTKLVPAYLPQEPKDPTSNAPYFYMAYNDTNHDTPITGNGTALSYHLGASLEGNGSTALANDRDLDDSGKSGFNGLDTTGKGCNSET